MGQIFENRMIFSKKQTEKDLAEIKPVYRSSQNHRFRWYKSSDILFENQPPGNLHHKLSAHGNTL